MKMIINCITWMGGWCKSRLKDCLQQSKNEICFFQVPWFCGHNVRCWEPGNAWALEQAKNNLGNEISATGQLFWHKDISLLDS